MIPHATPMNSCSARCASLRGLTGIPGLAAGCREPPARSRARRQPTRRARHRMGASMRGRCSCRDAQPGSRHRSRDPHAVAEPSRRFHRRCAAFERHLTRLTELAGMDPEDAFVVWPIGGGNAVFDRHRENEAVVVVGVLPDQVDPPGGERHPRRWRAELAPELLAGRCGSVSGGRRNHWIGDGSAWRVLCRGSGFGARKAGGTQRQRGAWICPRCL